MFAVAPNLSMVPRFGVAGWTIVLVTMGYLVVLAGLAARTIRGWHAVLVRPVSPGSS